MESGKWYTENDTKPESKDRLTYCDGYIRDIGLINGMIAVAGKCGGRVFGGYVRDVVVPRLINPNCEVSFNDVDIWFTKQEEADDFIKDMLLFSQLHENLAFVSKSNGSIKPGHMHYKFGRTQYYLYKNNKFVSFVDIIVSETIPVDDFNVNCLTYQYLNGEKIPKSFCEESVERLITLICNKEAVMFKEYAVRVVRREIFPAPNLFVRRMNKSYLKRGWTIYCFNNCKLPETIDADWVFTYFIPTANEYLKTV